MVEAAILGMLFCPIIVYATFFFDLSLLNLKVLEASRYATWEMTNIEELAWNWHPSLQSKCVVTQVKMTFYREEAG